MTNETLLLLIAVWTICAVGAYLIAAQKGAQSPGTWAFVGLVLGPIGVILAMVSARPATQEELERKGFSPAFKVIAGVILVVLAILLFATISNGYL